MVCAALVVVVRTLVAVVASVIAVAVVVGASVVVGSGATLGVQTPELPQGGEELDQYVPPGHGRKYGVGLAEAHSQYLVQSGRYSKYPLLLQVKPQLEPKIIKKILDINLKDCYLLRWCRCQIILKENKDTY